MLVPVLGASVGDVLSRRQFLRAEAPATGGAVSVPEG